MRFFYLLFNGTTFHLQDGGELQTETLTALVQQRLWELGLGESLPEVLARLEEGKRISTKRKGGDKQKQAVIQQKQTAWTFPALQKHHAQQAAASLDKEVNRFGNAIKKLIRRYQSKEITFRKMLSQSEDEFGKSVDKAFRLGTKAVGLVTPTGQPHEPTTNEQKWIDSYVKEELKYFERFMDDVKHGLNKAQVLRRVELYANAIRSVYESGRVLAVGEDVLIYWVLESDNPCIGCRILASHNPYTNDLLPTTPKGGSTPCRSHCYCSLRIQKATPDEIAKTTKGHKSAQWILKQIKQQQKS